MEIENKQQPEPVIDEQIRRRAEAIALFMGGDYDMTVGVGPWGSGWHWDFVKNHVNMDAKDLATESEDVVKGVASHEGNHRLVSRTDSIMDVWQEPGFSFGFNAVEDPRANEGGMKFMPGSRKWIQSYIERDLSPGGGLDYQGMEKAAKDKMGYVPDFMKWGSDIIRYWYEKEFAGGVNSPETKKKFLAGIPNPDVRKAVEKTLDNFEKYYKTLPDTKDEMDIRWKAQEAAQNFKENIWPEYQKLVEKSIDDNSFAKMLQDMMQQDGQGQPGQPGQSGQKGGQPMVIPFSSLPKDVQEEIKKKVEEAEKEAQKEAQSGQGQQEGKQEGGQNSDQGQEGQSSQSQESGKKKMPWDKLSEKAKKAAEDAFGGLPKNKQKDYKDAAKKDIENIEDEANEKLRGKMNDPRSVETHEEKDKREQGEKERSRGKSGTNQKVQDIENEVERVMEDIPENAYHEFLKEPEVDAIRRQMERDLKKIFEPTESPDARYSYSGLRPSMGKAMQMEADPRKTNIFESKGKPTERVFRFMFLIDLSGSMSGSKILETFKALIPIIESLNRFGIEFEVAGFSSGGMAGNLKVYKQFETKKLDQKSREKLNGLLNDGGGGTPLMDATRRSYKILTKRMTQVVGGRNYLITLTDGQPTDCTEEELTKEIKEIRKNKSVVTVGFGIGPDTAYINDSYPKLPKEVANAVARKLRKSSDKVGNSFKSASEFGEVFAIIAEYMVRRPELFVS